MEAQTAPTSGSGAPRADGGWPLHRDHADRVRRRPATKTIDGVSPSRAPAGGMSDDLHLEGRPGGRVRPAGEQRLHPGDQHLQQTNARPGLRGSPRTPTPARCRPNCHHRLELPANVIACRNCFDIAATPTTPISPVRCRWMGRARSGRTSTPPTCRCSRARQQMPDRLF